jgi:hypothetical protein
MNKILYNSEIKQVNGYFDLVFDTQKLTEDWKPALLELINCQIFTKKRLKDIEAKNTPISQRGGSPIDFVFNTTGKLYGTYIEDTPNQTGSLDDKDLAIKDTVIDKLAELKKDRIIEEYSFETISINKTTGKIEYKLYVKAGKNVISQQFSI